MPPQWSHRGNAKKGLQAFINHQIVKNLVRSAVGAIPRAPAHRSRLLPSLPQPIYNNRVFHLYEHTAELVCQTSNQNVFPSARRLCFQALAKNDRQVSFPDSDLPRKSPRNSESTTPASVIGIVHTVLISRRLLRPLSYKRLTLARKPI
jgi:hypothetical protein